MCALHIICSIRASEVGFECNDQRACGKCIAFSTTRDSDECVVRTVNTKLIASMKCTMKATDSKEMSEEPGVGYEYQN